MIIIVLLGFQIRYLPSSIFEGKIFCTAQCKREILNVAGPHLGQIFPIYGFRQLLLNPMVGQFACPDLCSQTWGTRHHKERIGKSCAQNVLIYSACQHRQSQLFFQPCKHICVYLLPHSSIFFSQRQSDEHFVIADMRRSFLIAPTTNWIPVYPHLLISQDHYNIKQAHSSSQVSTQQTYLSHEQFQCVCTSQDRIQE